MLEAPALAQVVLRATAVAVLAGLVGVDQRVPDRLRGRLDEDRVLEGGHAVFSFPSVLDGTTATPLETHRWASARPATPTAKTAIPATTDRQGRVTTRTAQATTPKTLSARGH